MGYNVVYEMGDLEGKTVFVRFDFNVTLEDGKASPDDKRLVGAKPTIEYIRSQGAKLIMASHFGRPKGKVVEEMRLKPVAKALEKLLGKPVTMAPGCVGDEVEKIISRMNNGEMLLLENLRFHPGEEGNDKAFAKQLGDLADVFIFDAFGTAHREHASTAGIIEYMKQQGKPLGIGYLVEKEIRTFDPIINISAEDRANTVIVIGGAKLKEKMLGATKLPGVYGAVIVGGMPYNVFRKAQGIDVADSHVTEKDGEDYTTEAEEALGKYSNIILSEQVIVGNSDGFEKMTFKDTKEIQISDGVPVGYMIVGVIPSEQVLSKIRDAKYIINFGTLGLVEADIKKGDLLVAEAMRVNKNNPFILYCGGDSAKLPKLLGLKDLDIKTSTGGGSAMEWVVYRDLPTLKLLRE